MKKMMKRANEFVVKQAIKARLAVSNNKGEGYIDTAVKILIAVVLGALLLAGLYAAQYLGYAKEADFSKGEDELDAALSGLRLPRASWSADDAKGLQLRDGRGNMVRPCGSP